MYVRLKACCKPVILIFTSTPCTHYIAIKQATNGRGSTSSRDPLEKMDDKDSKLAPSPSPVMSTGSGSTRENSTKRLTDKFLVQAKNYVETGSERKALEGTLSFLKLKSLRHNDARKVLHAAGLIECLQSLLVSGGAGGEEGDGVKALAWSILANLCAIDKRVQEKVKLGL